MYWVPIRRSLLRVCLPCAGTSALAFTLLSAAALPSAFAQACTPDPFGGEVCLPEEEPDEPNDPKDPNKPKDPGDDNEDPPTKVGNPVEESTGGKGGGFPGPIRYVLC